jgi:hypothetical protein
MKALFFSIFLFASSLTAAGPITHVVLAERYFIYQAAFSGERDEFLRGTLFPDIRYIAQIARSDTHEKGVPLASIKTQTPFIAGEKFHAYVDEERERFAASSGISRHIAFRYRIPRVELDTFLKLVEDEILYSGFDEGSISPALFHVSSEEHSGPIPFAQVIKYHFFLSAYFSVPPHQTLDNLIALKKGFFNVPYEITLVWKERLPRVTQDPRVRQYVVNLLNHFDAAFRADSGQH